MFKIVIISLAAIIVGSHAYSDPNDAHAQTLKYNSNIKEDGSYQYAYDTSNGISTQESGYGGNYATGSYSYYSPEGTLVQISYLADENGYQPRGDILPTPPPIPYQILKSLEYIRTHPQYDESQEQQYRHNYFNRYRSFRSQRRFS